MRLIILGSGTSCGIPVVNCSCRVCYSDDPRDKRMRSSLYIEGSAGERVVIDTGPEFRLQAIRAHISRLDAVFLTHTHADHIHGLDDLRPLCYKTPIPIYGNAQTIQELRERFSYIFKDTQQGGGKPKINPVALAEPVQIGALTITPIPVQHGVLDILGWKISESSAEGNAVTAIYLTDTSRIPETSFKLLYQPEVVIIGGLRIKPHETHFTFQEALHAAMQMLAHQIYLTHICHEHSHQDIIDFCRTLQISRNSTGTYMGPAYDGLELIVGAVSQ